MPPEHVGFHGPSHLHASWPKTDATLFSLSADASVEKRPPAAPRAEMPGCQAAGAVSLAARLAMHVLSSWLFVMADGAVTTRFCRLESFWRWSSYCWIKDSL